MYIFRTEGNEPDPATIGLWHLHVAVSDDLGQPVREMLGQVCASRGRYYIFHGSLPRFFEGLKPLLQTITCS